MHLKDKETSESLKKLRVYSKKYKLLKHMSIFQNVTSFLLDHQAVFIFFFLNNHMTLFVTQKENSSRKAL